MNYKLTDEDIKFICDPTITGSEICEKYKCGIATVVRWRKKYNANIPIGSKKGKSKDYQRNGDYIRCKFCDKEYYVPKNRLNASKYCSKKCQFLDPDFREILRHIDRSYTQTEEFALKQSKPDTKPYKKYCGKVHRLTRKVYEKHKDIINPNNYPRTLCGVEGGWQLDHIITIRYGFDNNIPPEEIAQLSNLRMIAWEENLARNKKARVSIS